MNKDKALTDIIMLGCDELQRIGISWKATKSDS